MDHHKCVALKQLYDCFLLTLKCDPGIIKDVSRKAKYMKVANELLVFFSKTNCIAFKYGMYCVLAVIYICTIFKY